jgi:ribonucleoside-triphosphate reductase
MTKDYALNYIVSDMARKNHLENMIYIHDLDNYAVGSHNCLTIPFDKLLAEGFNTRQCDIRPANSINTAFQLVAVIFQLQSLCQFGGVSASHIDWTMVPYVRKSFMKHYIMEFLKSTGDFYKLDLMNMSEDELDEWVNEHKQAYLDSFNLSEKDFYFENKEKLNLFYQEALYFTRKEIYQAVEACYHNLNTL